jgi:hypothetical protein
MTDETTLNDPASQDAAELPTVQATQTKRPGFWERVTGANKTLVEPGILGKITAPILAGANPQLYNERVQTNKLVDSALAPDGTLAFMAASNPQLADELRSRAQQPMSSQEHEQFRSGILSLVGTEVKREQDTQYQLQDINNFRDSFHQLDGMFRQPTDATPGVISVDDARRRQVETLINQAQEVAKLDPARAKEMMADAKQKADSITEHAIGQLDKVEKSARIEDGDLASAHNEQITNINDIVGSLENDRDAKGVWRAPNPAIVARGMAQLGRASTLPTSGFSETAQAAAPGVGAAVGGTKGGLIEAGVGLVGKVVDKITEGKDTQALIDRLNFQKQQLVKDYATNRQQLVDKYKPYGLQFGQQPGDVVAVVAQNYKDASGKIPDKTSTPEAKAADETATYRDALTQEVRDSMAAVDSLKNAAASNVPGARSDLAAAVERAGIAHDNLAIFEDDNSKQTGQPLPQGLQGDVAAKAIQQARARRNARDITRAHSQIRSAITDSLRNFTR